MNVQSRTRVFEWFKRRSTENPSYSRNDRKNFSCRLLTNELKNAIITKDTIHDILTIDINKRKMYAWFMLYALTDKQ